MDSPTVSNESVRIKYDAATKRVDVFYGERRVTIPGTYETSDGARKAAEAYARRYLGKK